MRLSQLGLMLRAGPVRLGLDAPLTQTTFGLGRRPAC